MNRQRPWLVRLVAVTLVMAVLLPLASGVDAQRARSSRSWWVWVLGLFRAEDDIQPPDLTDDDREALDAIGTWLNNYPDSEAAQVLRALAMAASRNEGQAVALLRTTQGPLDPESPLARTLTGQVYLQAGQLSEAVAQHQAALARLEQSGRPPLLLANSLLDLATAAHKGGQTAAAAESIGRAEKILEDLGPPGLPQVGPVDLALGWKAVGDAYSMIAEQEAAEADREAAAGDPQAAEKSREAAARNREAARTAWRHGTKQLDAQTEVEFERGVKIDLELRIAEACIQLEDVDGALEALATARSVVGEKTDPRAKVYKQVLIGEAYIRLSARAGPAWDECLQWARGLLTRVLELDSPPQGTDPVWFEGLQDRAQKALDSA